METLTRLLSSIFSLPALLIGVAFTLTLYYVLKSGHDFFEKRGVPHRKPVPILGNLAPVFFRKKHYYEQLIEYYNRFSQHRFFGFFDYVSPVYMIRDIDLVKQICIRDHDYFLNHRMEMDENHDPLFGRSLFVMRDARWRNMRSVLSPAFTGSKMRLMFQFVTDYCDRSVATIQSELKQGPVEYEMKDLFQRLCNDLLASCAFGIETDSLKDKDNTFFTLGRILTNLDGLQSLKFIFFSAFPKLMSLLRITMFTPELTNYFHNLVHDTIKKREQSGVVRNDMINLLLDARKQELKWDDDQQIIKDGTEKRLMNWSDEDITAQCTVFIFGGYDTVATVASFMAHELAVNPHVQQKLREEVDQVRNDLQGQKITYDVLQSMRYMDMVINESLRKWPPAAFIDRICTKSYVLQNDNGQKVDIEPGTGILIPAIAIMKDPKYFPDPDRFDPERHAPENKSSHDAATLLGFGLGPRNCIGSRFALMEMKAMFYYLLSNFTLDQGPRTQHPLRLKKSTPVPLAELGCFVRFSAR